MAYRISKSIMRYMDTFASFVDICDPYCWVFLPWQAWHMWFNGWNMACHSMVGGCWWEMES